MDDRKALMAAIIANPEEDTPRLALADWLQEHGDKADQARAEFMRLQVRAAALPEGKERGKLETAAQKLEKKHRQAWLAPMAALGSHFTPDDYVDFTRGLLGYQWVTTSEYLIKSRQEAQAEALAAVGVEGLYFHNPTKRLDALAASPGLRWVAEVLYYGANDDALLALGQSPNTAHLSQLDLQEAGVTDKGLRAFAEGANMPNLRKLDLTPDGALTKHKAKFSAAGVLALLRSGRFPRLSSIRIESRLPTKFGAEEFFSDPAIKQLTELCLEPGCPLALVAACPHLTNMRELIIHDTTVTNADVDTFLANSAFANLKEFSLSPRTRLAPASEKKLRARFGAGLSIDYTDD